MSKQTEALKLALEALREIERLPGISSANLYARRALKAIEALAEQPAQQQEPVAWFELLREARDNCKASIVEEGISASRKEYRIDLEARLTAALNTSPPASQRSVKPWRGLTDEEIEKLSVESGKATFLNDDEQTDILWFDGDCIRLARAIEAKLKEKNSG